LIEAPEEFVAMPRDADFLVTRLNELYPHRCIGVNESLEQAQRYAGMRELVDFLVHWRDETIEYERQAAHGQD
jgi:hypothetical protein